MGQIQYSSLFQNQRFLLGLIILAYLIREVFLATLFPLFTGQDEARHYNTIQWLTKDHTQTCYETLNTDKQEKRDLSSYRFSPEIKSTSLAIRSDSWRGENYHKATFAPGMRGANEALITANTWASDRVDCAPDIAPTSQGFSLYHRVGSLIEHALGGEDVLTRFYLIRFLSIFFGVISISFAYLATQEAGFTSRAALLIAFILSLQPKLSVYITNINYDTLLITCFTLFLWAGIRCLKQGLSPRNLFMLILALCGAIFTKGTGLVLIGGLIFILGWTALRHRTTWRKLSLHSWFLVAFIGTILLFLVFKTYPPSSLFPSLNPWSLFDYLSKSLPKLPSAAESYWGIISWTEAQAGIWFVWIIWLIDSIALFGLVLFWKNKKTPASFLPNKLVLAFILTIFISLQLGIRLFDWRVYQGSGSLALGTPGRYFLPVLLPQLLLIATGLGTILKQRVALERVLGILSILMLAFHLYNTWLVIIPRFYL